jgi:hypothetical protein
MIDVELGFRCSVASLFGGEVLELDRLGEEP